MSERATIGCYKVLHLLGRGGMGEVYLAEDPRLGRQVAVKVLGERALKSEESRRRFEREARTAAQLAHPNIVHIYEVGEDDGLAYIVMEHVEGRTLRELIQQEPATTEKLLKLAEGIADGLAAAHDRGIIHRDIKPANILVDPDGRPRILDFGLAKALDAGSGSGDDEEDDRSTISQITQARKVMGTVAYMSPEQAAGKTLDHRSDIFSFGVVLYQMVCGQLPFAGDSDITTLVAILRDTPASLQAWGDTAPPELEQIIFRCLEKRPEDRYQSTREMLEDLRALARGTMSQGYRADSKPTPWRGIRPASSSTTTAARPREARWGLVASLAILAAAGVGLYLTTGLRPVWKQNPDAEYGAALAPEIPDPFEPTSEEWEKSMAEVQRQAQRAVRRADRSMSFVFEPGPGVGRPGRVLAILGFRNHTGDEELDWIASGLPEILITDLGDLKGIRMVGTRKLSDLASRMGVSWEKGLPPKVGWQIAQDAGADLLLTGSLFQSSSGLRMDVGLEDMRDGTVVYSEKQVGDDVFELAGKLTESLRAKLGIVPSGKKHESREQLTTSEPAMVAFSRAMVEFNRAETGQAIPYLEKAVQIDPEFLLARLRLLQCYRIEGQAGEVEKQLDFLRKRKEKLDAKHAKLLALYDADTRMSIEQTLQAVDGLKPFAEADPEIGLTVCRVQIKVGRMTQDDEQVEEGLDCLEKIYEKDPLFAPAVQVYSAALDMVGRESEAMDLLAQYSKSRPEDARMRTFYAQSLQKANRLDRAQEELKQVVRKRPSDALALQTLTSLARRLENFDDAERWLSKLLDGKGTPARIQAAIQEVALQSARGHIEAALEVVRRGSKLALETGDRLASFRLQTTMAELLLALGRAEDAWKLGEKSVAEVPGKESMKALETAIYARAAGQTQRAQELEAETFNSLKGEASQLEPFFQQLIGLAETTAQAEFDAAADLAGDVRNSEPAYVYYPLVRLAFEQKKLDWLREYLQEAVEKMTDPSDPLRIYAHYWLGRVEDADGHETAARTAYREFLHWWGSGDASIPEIAQARTRLRELEKKCPDGRAEKCPEVKESRHND